MIRSAAAAAGGAASDPHRRGRCGGRYSLHTSGAWRREAVIHPLHTGPGGDIVLSIHTGLGGILSSP